MQVCVWCLYQHLLAPPAQPARVRTGTKLRLLLGPIMGGACPPWVSPLLHNGEQQGPPPFQESFLFPALYVLCDSSWPQTGHLCLRMYQMTLWSHPPSPFLDKECGLTSFSLKDQTWEGGWAGGGRWCRWVRQGSRSAGPLSCRLSPAQLRALDIWVSTGGRWGWPLPHQSHGCTLYKLHSLCQGTYSQLGP